MKNIHKIKIISPSGIVQEEYVSGAAQVLRQNGFDVEIGEHALSHSGRFAGNDTERAFDLLSALEDDSVDLILCARGGYGAVRILDKIGIDTIKHYNKPIVGFSDITALHALWAKAGVKSIHAPMCKHLATSPDEAPQKALIDLLRGKKLKYHFAGNPQNRIGITSGKIIGGNLSVLYGLRGTPFDYSYTNKILFIEDLGERKYHIDRMLRNLWLGGVFKKIRGLIVGHFSDIEEDDRMPNIYDMIDDLTKDSVYPVVYGFPIGHMPQNYPLILGATAKLEVSKSFVTLSQNHL